jgi:hypothetical protein
VTAQLVNLVLYGRSGCHLCEEMKAGLLAMQETLGFELSEVAVGWEGELADRYGTLLPVLEKDGVEICHYFLDPERLKAAFG